MVFLSKQRFLKGLQAETPKEVGGLFFFIFSHPSPFHVFFSCELFSFSDGFALPSADSGYVLFSKVFSPPLL